MTAPAKAQAPPSASPLSVRHLLRRFRWQLITVLVYLLSEQLFIVFAADHGIFFAAASAKSFAIVALGLVIMALRLLVYIALPAVIFYKLTNIGWETVARRRRLDDTAKAGEE